MNDTMKATIATLTDKVVAKTKELAELKRTINFLAREAGEEEIYPDDSPATEIGSGQIRPDQYYGKSPITAAREYLEMRGRAVPPEEIAAALERGGFDFEAQKWKKPDRLRSLAISLSKNSVIFHRLPNGTYGLVKFYPDIQTEKKQKKAEAAEEGPETDKKAAGATEGREQKGGDRSEQTKTGNGEQK